MTTIWYLIVSFGLNGGVATIPQPSREACMQTAAWVAERRYYTGTLSFATCVPGVK